MTEVERKAEYCIRFPEGRRYKWHKRENSNKLFVTDDYKEAVTIAKKIGPLAEVYDLTGDVNSMLIGNTW